jgi:hypothetical protein
VDVGEPPALPTCRSAPPGVLHDLKYSCLLPQPTLAPTSTPF